MYDKEKVIRVAKDQVGYLEKASNDHLDDKTANVGYANFTKYARDLDKLGDFYNGPKNGYSWCDVFVDWCFVTAYGREAAQMLLCQPNRSYGAGCEESARYYAAAGRLAHYPEAGDQIFFRRGGEVCHTGIVWYVDDRRVYTIEGNTSGESGVVANGGGVFSKSYRKDDPAIYGYGRPNWSGETKRVEAAPAEPVTNHTERKDVCKVELPILRRGAKNGYVRTLQILLNKYNGAGLVEDGDFGNATYRAVIRYQKDRRLDVDGEVGSQTWGQLLK